MHSSCDLNGWAKWRVDSANSSNNNKQLFNYEAEEVSTKLCQVLPQQSAKHFSVDIIYICVKQQRSPNWLWFECVRKITKKIVKLKQNTRSVCQTQTLLFRLLFRSLYPKRLKYFRHVSSFFFSAAIFFF